MRKNKKNILLLLFLFIISQIYSINIQPDKSSNLVNPGKVRPLIFKWDYKKLFSNRRFYNIIIERIIPVTDTSYVIGDADLKVQYRCMERCYVANQIKPHLNIINNGPYAVNLNELTLRYYYTMHNPADQSFSVDYARIGTDNIQGKFVMVDETHYYLEVSFTPYAGILGPSCKTGEIQLRFNKQDWSYYNQSNDYSFNNMFTYYGDYQKITLYRNGQLVWGKEPPPDYILPTATPTAIPTSSPTDEITPSPTVEPTFAPTPTIEPTQIPTATLTPTEEPTPIITPTATPKICLPCMIEINGKIYDSDSGIPIPGANITGIKTELNREDDISTAVTDDFGNYQLIFPTCGYSAPEVTFVIEYYGIKLYEDIKIYPVCGNFEENFYVSLQPDDTPQPTTPFICLPGLLTVQGNVSDKNTGAIIAGAVVRGIKKELYKDDNTAATITDETGFYQLDFPTCGYSKPVVSYVIEYSGCQVFTMEKEYPAAGNYSENFTLDLSKLTFTYLIDFGAATEPIANWNKFNTVAADNSIEVKSIDCTSNILCKLTDCADTVDIFNNGHLLPDIRMADLTVPTDVALSYWSVTSESGYYILTLSELNAEPYSLEFYLGGTNPDSTIDIFINGMSFPGVNAASIYKLSGIKPNSSGKITIMLHNFSGLNDQAGIHALAIKKEDGTL